MGECMCNTIEPDLAWKLPDGNVLTLQIYPGCENCFQGVGVQLYLFDKDGQKQWLEGVEFEELPAADEYGANNGVGISIPCIDIEELIKGLRSSAANHNDTVTWYDDTSDWIEDNLFQMLRKHVIETVAIWRKSGNRQ